MVAHNTLRTCEGKQVFFKIKFKYATVADLNKCNSQIKFPTSFYPCALISGLPFDISTMALCMGKTVINKWGNRLKWWAAAVVVRNKGLRNNEDYAEHGYLERCGFSLKVSRRFNVQTTVLLKFLIISYTLILIYVRWEGANFKIAI